MKESVSRVINNRGYVHVKPCGGHCAGAARDYGVETGNIIETGIICHR